MEKGGQTAGRGGAHGPTPPHCALTAPRPAPPAPPPSAHRVVSGTSLAAVLATAVTSAYTYSAQGCVDPGAALLIAPAALLTAPLGARLTARLDCTALRRILGYFLLAVAPMVPLKVGGWASWGPGGCLSSRRGRTAAQPARLELGTCPVPLPAHLFPCRQPAGVPAVWQRRRRRQRCRQGRWAGSRRGGGSGGQRP